jgi:hypothetical protein
MNTKQRRPAAGQSINEFALIIFILLVIFILILDLGRAVYYYSAVYNSAREGARYGSIDPDNTTAIENRVRDYTVGLDSDELTITILYPDDETIQVVVSYEFQAVTPLVYVFSGSNIITLNSQATMYIEPGT